MPACTSRFSSETANSNVSGCSRALVVGLICAIVHNAIMIGGDYAGLHYATLSLDFVPDRRSHRLSASQRMDVPLRRAEQGLLYALCGNREREPPVLIRRNVRVREFDRLVGAAGEPIVTVLLFGMNFMGNRWALKAGRRKA